MIVLKLSRASVALAAVAFNLYPQRAFGKRQSRTSLTRYACGETGTFYSLRCQAVATYFRAHWSIRVGMLRILKSNKVRPDLIEDAVASGFAAFAAGEVRCPFVEKALADAWWAGYRCADQLDAAIW
jgi:hypothetical protein